MIQKATYLDINTILNELKEAGPFLNLDGDSIKTDSLRYHLFRQSTDCCVCGLGSNAGDRKIFIKEKAMNHDRRYHLNLYVINSYGVPVLMTKDHILPKSRGGEDLLENMQCMCTKCNMKKANSILSNERVAEIPDPVTRTLSIPEFSIISGINFNKLEDEVREFQIKTCTNPYRDGTDNKEIQVKIDLMMLFVTDFISYYNVDVEKMKQKCYKLFSKNVKRKWVNDNLEICL